MTSKVGQSGGGEPSSGESHRLPEHLPQLDGARGVAFLLVLVYHAMMERGPSAVAHRLTVTGWIGVDLFFVLSGFLITRILLREKESAHYFGAFYGRRVLRIFPVYYGTLLVTLFVLPMISPELAATFGFGRLPLLTFTANLIPLVTHMNIKVMCPVPLSHLWSLMVEEHFYLLWPLLVWCLPRRWLVATCFAFFALAAATRAGLHRAGYDVDMIYEFTPGRIDTLAGGALLAVLIDARGGVSARFARAGRWMLLASGLALGAVAVHDSSLYHYGAWMQLFGYPTLTAFWAGGLLVALASPIEAPLNRVLACAPLRFAGRYSYGGYVYHVPVLMFVSHHFDLWARLDRLTHSPLLTTAIYLPLVAAVVLAFAVPSYELVERPCLSLKRFFNYDDPPDSAVISQSSEKIAS